MTGTLLTSINITQQSYSHELATALSLGSSGEEKIKYTLPSKFGEDLGIIFEDSTKGRIVTWVHVWIYLLIEV